MKENSRILDLGCGNGRVLHYISNQYLDYTGLDISEELLNKAKQLAQEKKDKATFSFIKGDLTNLPFKNQSFDTAIAIASLFHIPSKALRKRTFQEIARVLRKDGIFIMTYWNMWTPPRVYLIIKNILKKLIGKSKFDFFDTEKPWKNPKGEVMAKRYAHAFTLREVVRQLKKLGFRIENQFYSQRGIKAHFWNGYNGIIIAKKH